MRPRDQNCLGYIFIYSGKMICMIYTFSSVDVRRGLDPALTMSQLGGPWRRKLTKRKICFEAFLYQGGPDLGGVASRNIVSPTFNYFITSDNHLF